jgi:hypothetical protein
MKRAIAGLVLALLVTGTAAAKEPAPGEWHWRATVYGWFPSIKSSSTSFDTGGGNTIGTETDPDGYLKHLEFAFMGAIEARQGRWSAIGDAIYLNFGNAQTRVKTISGPAGLVSIPAQANVTWDLEGAVITLAAGYSLSQSADPADVIVGLRRASLKPSLSWSFGGPVATVAQQGSAELSESFTDAIVGLRGRAGVGSNWFVPYHVDIGTGSTRFTWQALAGIGYRFDWGDATAIYRHLSYDFKDDSPISDIRFSGPAIGLSFTF